MTFHVNVDGAWKDVAAVYVNVNGVWKEGEALYYNDAPRATLANGGLSWRKGWERTGLGNGPRIVGPRLGTALRASTWLRDLPGVDWNGYESVPYSYDPVVPSYAVEGDVSKIVSAKVTLTYLPVSPKEPVEQTIAWEAPVGWGLYEVFWYAQDPAQPVGTSKTFFYYAAMTDAEAAAFSEPGKNILRRWTPRDGGAFVYMPVCWDAAGVTVPMRTDADGGLDPYSGYTPFPPTRSATSTLTDYTVVNGYTDMARPFLGAPPIYDVLIELKGAGGVVLDSWSGTLPINGDWLGQDTPKAPEFRNTPLERPSLWIVGAFGYAGPQTWPEAVPEGMKHSWNPSPSADPQGNAFRGADQTTAEGGVGTLTLTVDSPAGSARWRPTVAFQASGPWHTPDGTEQTETVVWENPVGSGMTGVQFGIEVETGDWPNAGTHTVTGYDYSYVPPAVMALGLSRRQDNPKFPMKDLYWPHEWNGLFDNVPTLGSDVTIRFGRETVHGIGEWDVSSEGRGKIGDFRLALRYGWPDIIEIHGVNLQPDLVGRRIMRTIVRHGVEFCPVRYVVVKPPDRATFEVMRSWGWKSWEDGSTALRAATWLEEKVPDEIPLMLGMESSPQQNNFTALGLPSAAAVVRHV